MKIIKYFLIPILVLGCKNGTVPQEKKSILQLQDVKIKAPRCPNYKFQSIKKTGRKLLLKVNCSETSYCPLTEREYFLYCLKNAQPYISQENLDSVICEFNYVNQGNRKVELSMSKKFAIEGVRLRDSANTPIMFNIVESIINDSNYNSTILFMSYIYGKATIGEKYNFFDNADVFEFYYAINNEILFSNSKECLKTLMKMETNINPKSGESAITKHLRYLKNLYNNR